MNGIVFIFLNDIKRVLTNWAALVVIGGLVVLPSLYAWFNIEASWDPYGQTGRLPVAVASDDRGAVIRGQAVNIGGQIIDTLRSNTQIGWVFVSSAEVPEGVKRGDYYAGIVIPDNFSERIATVLTDEPTKAEIDYVVNEKINAITPKITEKGASGVVEEVSRSFIRAANGAIFDVFNEVGTELETNLPLLEKARDFVFRLEEMFPELYHMVDTALADIDKANEIVAAAQTHAAAAAKLATEGRQLADQLGPVLERSGQALDTAQPVIKQDLAMLQQSALAVRQLAAMANDPAVDPAVLQAALAQAPGRLAAAKDVTSALSALFTQLQAMTGQTAFAGELQALERIRGNLDKLTNIVSTAQSGQQLTKEAAASLETLAAQAADLSGAQLDRYDSETAPRITAAVEKAKSAAANAYSALQDAVSRLPDVQQVLNDAAAGLQTGRKELLAIREALPELQAGVKTLADQIRKLDQEGGIGELIRLLKLNAGKEREFFAEPVILREQALFPIPNYGSAMSPFFTTLSLWVGALLLVSLLSVNVHDPVAAFRSYQEYFGRFLTFWLLSLLQSLLVTLGDIGILGTYVADKPRFVVFGLLLSSVFMLIVYTLVSVFGNVGKALAIVLLVLQLAGSGGTFPIQLTPPFFQHIHPYLPFTYAIGMMREAVGGILWDVLAKEFRIMLIYVVAALLIGLVLKPWINRSGAAFVRKAKESGLIH